jgi:hypothetical protein
MSTLEVSAGRPAELEDLQLVIDQHARRRESMDGDAVGLALGLEFGSETFRPFSALSPDQKRPGRLLAR